MIIPERRAGTLKGEVTIRKHFIENPSLVPEKVGNVLMCFSI